MYSCIEKGKKIDVIFFLFFFVFKHIIPQTTKRKMILEITNREEKRRRKEKSQNQKMAQLSRKSHMKFILLLLFLCFLSLASLKGICSRKIHLGIIPLRFLRGGGSKWQFNQLGLGMKRGGKKFRKESQKEKADASFTELESRKESDDELENKEFRKVKETKAGTETEKLQQEIKEEETKIHHTDDTEILGEFNPSIKLHEPSNSTLPASTASVSTSRTHSFIKLKDNSLKQMPKKRGRRQLAIILDVDGTLYPAGGNHFLELEIVRRIHRHCREYYGINPEEADRLHNQFGSTIEGLRVSRSLSSEHINFFYKDVYGSIDVRWLLSSTSALEKGAPGGQVDEEKTLPYTSSPIRSHELDRNEEDEMDQIDFESIEDRILDDDNEEENENHDPLRKISFRQSNSITNKSNNIQNNNSNNNNNMENPTIDYSYSTNQDKDATGYSTASSAFAALKNFEGPIIVASNSPLIHIQRVLTSLGLVNLPIDMIVTPDSSNNPNFYTKSNQEYWRLILDRFPLAEYDLVLIDDSRYNLKKAAFMGIRGQQVVKQFKLEEALAVATGSILPPVKWSMNDIKYIDAKNEIDRSSYSRLVLETLQEKIIKKKELQREKLNQRGGNQKTWNDIKLATTKPKTTKSSIFKTDEENDGQLMTTSTLFQNISTLKVLDLGAGLLSMLPYFMKMQKKAKLSNLTYIAVESNPLLVQEVIRRLTMPTSYTVTQQNENEYGSSSIEKEEEEEGKRGEERMVKSKSNDNDMKNTTLASVSTAWVLPEVRGTFHIVSRRPIFGQEDTSMSNMVGVGGPGSIHLSNDHGVDIMIHCCPFESIPRQFNVDVVVGCCLIDLIDPVNFIKNIIKIVHTPQGVDERLSTSTGSGTQNESSTNDININTKEDQARSEEYRNDSDNECEGPLLYFPISFAGRTTFKQDPTLLSSPSLTSEDKGKVKGGKGKGSHEEYGDNNDNNNNNLDDVYTSIEADHNVPSDAMITKYYHYSLREIQGHYIDINRFQSVLADFGCPLITAAPSSWIIKNKDHQYMYRSILRFMGLGLLSISLKKKWNFNQWMKQKLADKSSFIDITNVDLLFQLEASMLNLSTSQKNDNNNKNSNNNSNNDIEESVSKLQSTVRADTMLSKQIPITQRINSFVEFQGPRLISIKKEIWEEEEQNEEEEKGKEKATTHYKKKKTSSKERKIVPLEARGVELEAVTSLISAGTELKIFRGDFNRGEKTDTNIEAFKDSTMDYPMKYGYSHVGRIVRVGSEIKDEEKETLLGRLVFTFSPHESRVIIQDIDANGGLMLVPPGISAEDAVFLPSVETALSLIHDANPLCGETVAVIGQGLIGLLATKLLRRHCGIRETVSCDLSPSRRALSKLAGCKHAMSPQEFYMSSQQQQLQKQQQEEKQQVKQEQLQPGKEATTTATSATTTTTFLMEKPDITIEVSGHPSGLQTAIDNTRFGGKVILGSWYGDKAISTLVLGLPFHRSHLQLITSQVSDIPARLTNRWSKKRRFDTTWKILKDIQPAKWLVSKTISLTKDEVQTAYESLDKSGETIGVLIKY